MAPDQYDPPKAQQITAARDQIAQFKAERFGHKLNLTRLSAIPADQRDETWNAAVRAARQALATVAQAIDSTQAAIDAVTADRPITLADAPPEGPAA